MRKTNDYRFDHAKKTITITRSYEERASIVGSKEFRELSQLHQAYPDYIITHRTARITKPKNNHKGLSKEVMKKYITVFDEKGMEAFEKIEKFYGEDTNAFSKIKSWFLKKHPDYEKDASFFMEEPKDEDIDSEESVD